MNFKFAVRGVLSLMVCSAVFAGTSLVKSKKGSIDLAKSESGSGVVCTAPFSEEMKLLNKKADHALVKAECGQGWVAVKDLETVVAGPGDKSMKLEDVDIVGWLDDPNAVFVLDNNVMDFEGITLNRNFKEYLEQTMDREKVERTNNDN